ncbi:tail fiber domain-containing protein [Candidatus Margulisiibacteriota bacterium]
MTTDIQTVNSKLPLEQAVNILNDNDKKLFGKYTNAQFTKHEINQVFSDLGLEPQYKRDLPLGNDLVSYLNWIHVKTETGYSVWKYPITYYKDNPDNKFYFDSKVLDYRGVATAEIANAFAKAFDFDGADYNDVTVEAASEEGTPFTVLRDIDNYLYIGHSSPFNGVDFEFETLGLDLNLTVEYSQGSSNWAEVQLLNDETSNFSRSGRLSFSLPGDFDLETVNGENYYWIRIKTSVVPIIIPTCYFIQPLTSVINILSLNSEQILSGNLSWCYFNGFIYATIKNSGVSLREGIDFITSNSSQQNRQNFFVSNHIFMVDYELSYYVSQPLITSQDYRPFGGDYSLELKINQGQCSFNGNFYTHNDTNLILPGNENNIYVFVDGTGTISYNITGFPIVCYPITEASTNGTGILQITDRRVFMNPLRDPFWVSSIGVAATRIPIIYADLIDSVDFNSIHVIGDITHSANIIPDNATGQNIGRADRRYDEIFLNDNIDYLNNLVFKFGGSPRVTFQTDGQAIFTNNISGTTANFTSLVGITGNLTVNTDNLFVNTSLGNVGIGTLTTPEKLTVAGNVLASQYKFDSSGPILKNENGHLAIKNNADSDYADLHAKDIILHGGSVTQLMSNEVLIGDNETMYNADITDNSQNSDGGIRIKLLDDELQRDIILISGNTITLNTVAGIEIGNFFEVSGCTNPDNDGMYLAYNIVGNDITVDPTFKAISTDQPGSAGNIAREVGARIRWDNLNLKWISEKIDGIAVDFEATGRFITEKYKFLKYAALPPVEEDVLIKVENNVYIGDSGEWKPVGSGGGGITSSFITIEDISDQIDGIKTVFVAGNNYTSDSLVIFVNGIRQTKDVDYEETSSIIFTFFDPVPTGTPENPTELVISYIKTSIPGLHMVRNDNLSAQADGINDTFTVTTTQYRDNTLEVFFNGQRKTIDIDYVILNPELGTFQFNEAPEADDIIVCAYDDRIEAIIFEQDIADGSVTKPKLHADLQAEIPFLTGTNLLLPDKLAVNGVYLTNPTGYTNILSVSDLVNPALSFRDGSEAVNQRVGFIGANQQSFTFAKCDDDGTNVVSLARITGDGNLLVHDGRIGIKNPSPNYSIDLYDDQPIFNMKNLVDANVTQIRQFNGTYAGYMTTYGNGYVGTYNGINLADSTRLDNTGSCTWITKTGNYPIRFGTNDLIRMTIKGDGKVGIGNGTPPEILSVKNSSGNLTVFLENLSHGDNSVIQFYAENAGGVPKGALLYLDPDTENLELDKDFDLNSNDLEGCATAYITTVDLGTNTITDGNLTGAWASITTLQLSSRIGSNVAAVGLQTTPNMITMGSTYTADNPVGANYKLKVYDGGGNAVNGITSTVSGLNYAVIAGGDHIFRYGNAGGAGTVGMVLKANGRVGIGTGNPGTPLEYYNGSGSGDLVMNIHNDSHGDNCVLAFYAENVSGSDRSGILTFNPDESSGAFSFNRQLEIISSVGNALEITSNTTTSAAVNIYGAGTADSWTTFLIRSDAGWIFAVEQNGDVRCPKTYNKTTGSSANVYISSDGTLYRSTSSERYKKNIRDIEVDTSKLHDLTPKTYESKTEDKTYNGLIAEDVHEHLPSACVYDEEGKPDAIEWNALITVAIAEIKKLKEEIELLKGA